MAQYYLSCIICHEVFVEPLTAVTGQWVEFPKVSVCQPWVLVAQESGVWGGGWSLNPIVPQPQPGSSTLWAPGHWWNLLVCSGLSLKYSSDVQRRRQLKLQAFPTINENKEQIHNFAVLFCMGMMLAVKEGAGEEAGTVTTGQAPRLCLTACWVLVKYLLILMGAARFCIFPDCCLCTQLYWQQQQNCTSPVIISPQEGKLASLQWWYFVPDINIKM